MHVLDSVDGYDHPGRFPTSEDEEIRWSDHAWRALTDAVIESTGKAPKVRLPALCGGCEALFVSASTATRCSRLCYGRSVATTRQRTSPGTA